MAPSKYLLIFFFFGTSVIGVLLVGSPSEVNGLSTKSAELGEVYDTETKYDFTIFHPSSYDTAHVNITNSLDETIYLWIQTTECYQCKMLLLGPVRLHTKAAVLVDTSWAVRMTVNMNNHTPGNSTVCEMTHHFKESGTYSWYVNYNTTSDHYYCKLVITNNPKDAFIPIYVAIGVFFGMALFYIGIKQLWSSGAVYYFLNFLGMERVVSSDLGTPSNPVSAADSNSIQRPSRDKPSRLKSLDAFRGMSLGIMIFVNYGGGKYWFFSHAAWNGLTVADLVFPWFIFIMGVSITMSFQSLVRHGVTRWTIFLKVLKRFVILFGLGLVLQGGTELAKFRVPGVLQRIAVSYFVVAVVHLLSAKRKDEEYRVRNAVYRELRDILDYWYEWIIMLSLLAVHVCLTFFLSVPGCTKGYLGPGGPLVGDGVAQENCTGGAANYIDKVILTYNHVYQHCTAAKIYKTDLPHDPEGILGTLTSIFIAFLGLQAGKIFHLFSYPRDRILRFLLWCVVTGLIAGALCGFSKEGGVIPVNKNLWSVSFVLTTASMAYFLLAVFYYMIDVQHWWTGVPFFFLGMNSIAAYCGSEILASYFPFSWQPVYRTHAEHLAMNIIGASLWVLITYFMFTINFFVKI